VKIATWNVNSLRMRHAHLAQWVKTAAPDVLCLQETKLEDHEFPHADLVALGYPHVVFRGERSYNGVAMLSKLPLDDVRFDFDDGVDDPQPRLVTARVAGIRVLGCYVPNGQEVGSPKFAYKLQWFDRLRAFLDRVASPSDDVLLCGDLNVAPGEADVWDPFQCDGRVLFHPAERAKVGELLAWGLLDAWREKNPFGSQFSWWDYQGMGFQRNHGFRIDHVLVSRSLYARCRAISIERVVRTWKNPSDHVPVVATFG
jgi:exodeoxyribonuclease III